MDFLLNVADTLPGAFLGFIAAVFALAAAVGVAVLWLRRQNPASGPCECPLCGGSGYIWPGGDNV